MEDLEFELEKLQTIVRGKDQMIEKLSAERRSFEEDLKNAVASAEAASASTQPIGVPFDTDRNAEELVKVKIENRTLELKNFELTEKLATVPFTASLWVLIVFMCGSG